MATKVETYCQMADRSTESLTAQVRDWTKFLLMVGKFYKYNFLDQVMIYTQRPDATACAEFELWARRMDRHVRRGAQGIALLRQSGSKTTLRYVFDVADTVRGKDGRDPVPWQYRDEYQAVVTARLEEAFKVPGGEGLDKQLIGLAVRSADEHWHDFGDSIMSTVHDSLLDELDEDSVAHRFRAAVTVSLSFLLLARCGFDLDVYFTAEDFTCIAEFNTRDAVFALGNAVSECANVILRQVEYAIKKYEHDKAVGNPPTESEPRHEDGEDAARDKSEGAARSLSRPPLMDKKYEGDMSMLYANIYKDELQLAYLFGTLVLYTTRPIPREDVPQGWYCYDLRGTAKDPDVPYALVDAAPDENRLASVLSHLPLKADARRSRLVKDKFRLEAVSATMKKFCASEKIGCPETPIRHRLRPASPDEAELFYALPPEKDEELGAIGHVRIDFGSSGTEFHHTWWPRGPKELNTQEFRDELGLVVDDLRKSVLKSLGAMEGYCWNHGGKIADGLCCQNYGYVLETERYIYRLRCNPAPGDYQAYLSCFVNQKEKLGLTETGLRKLRDAANPDLPHSYDWYVMEDYNTPEERFTSGLSLEDAIQRYAASERAGKRLGVTKDGIAAVDLLIRHDGREWVSEDWTQSESFSRDPVATGAVARLRQMLEGKSTG